ncbi:MAG: hypothetical protein MZW92_38950 [Comamonadaceae bacterium]|nr:hypothetical protein [Comamonadaceae bacterium]
MADAQARGARPSRQQGARASIEARSQRARGAHRRAARAPSARSRRRAPRTTRRSDAVHAAQGELLRRSTPRSRKLESEIRTDRRRPRRGWQAQVETLTGHARAAPAAKRRPARARRGAAQQIADGDGGCEASAAARWPSTKRRLPAVRGRPTARRARRWRAARAAAAAGRAGDRRRRRRAAQPRPPARRARATPRAPAKQERSDSARPTRRGWPTLQRRAWRGCEAELAAAAGGAAARGRSSVPRLQAERAAARSTRARSETETLAAARGAARRAARAAGEASRPTRSSIPGCSAQGLGVAAAAVPQAAGRGRLGDRVRGGAARAHRRRSRSAGSTRSAALAAQRAAGARGRSTRPRGAMARDSRPPAGFAPPRAIAFAATTPRWPPCWPTGWPACTSPTTWRRRWPRASSCRRAGSSSSQAGHLVSRYGVRFYAADDRKSGLLARRQEIENLEQRAARAEAARRAGASARWRRCEADAARGAGSRAGAARRDGRAAAQPGARARSSKRCAWRELVERVQAPRRPDRRANWPRSTAQDGELRAQREDADTPLRASSTQALADAAAGARGGARRLRGRPTARCAKRATTQQRARAGAAQQLEFDAGAARASGAPTSQHAVAVGRRRCRRASQVDTAGSAAADWPGSTTRAARTRTATRWLAQRASAEEALREARSRMDELAQQLRATDEKRLTLEREVQPRARQDHRAAAEGAGGAAGGRAVRAAAGRGARRRGARSTARLRRAGARQSRCRPRSRGWPSEIAALGAVNLAALRGTRPPRASARASSTRSRPTCKAAIDTLEDAIRKIDRETRELLQDTFDAGQRAVRPAVPEAVRRRRGEADDDRRGDPRRRRAGDGAAARQAQQHDPPAVRRREGADRDRAGVRAVQAEPGAVLPARRGRRAARRRQHRALLRAGAAR